MSTLQLNNYLIIFHFCINVLLVVMKLSFFHSLIFLFFNGILSSKRQVLKEDVNILNFSV